MAQQKEQFKRNTPKTEKKSKPEKPAEPEIQEKTVKGFINFIKNDKTHRITGLFLLVVAAYLFFAFSSYLVTWKADDNFFAAGFWNMIANNDYQTQNIMGRLGAITGHLFIKNWFGIASYLFILIAISIGLKLFFNNNILKPSKITRYSIFAILWLSITLGFIFKSDDLLILCGTFGYVMNIWLDGIFGMPGTALLLLFSFIVFLIVAFNTSFDWIKFRLRSIDNENENIEQDEERQFVASSLGNTETNAEHEDDEPLNSEEVEKMGEELVLKPENKEKKATSDDEIEFSIENLNDESNLTEEHTTIEEKQFNEAFEKASNIAEENNENAINPEEFEPYDPTKDLSSYITPNFDLLNDYGNSQPNVQKEELEANKNKIVETLNNYGIQIDKIKATIGPTVTLYEIIPAPGVRISKIKNLESDIALSLAALGIRIIAPIPGKGTIGIEVPNRKPEVVPMKSLLNGEKFINSAFELPLALGKTITNETFIADLTKMPHLLIAGATGMGKSVGLNAILASILHKKHPSQVKLVLVDPKKVELTLFSKIERHFLAKLPDFEEPIITDVKQAIRTLHSLAIEMDNRYDLLKIAGVRTIKEYNTKFIARKLNPKNGHRFLPYIILVVDEFADLIMTAGKEVEFSIQRLAQLARAIGIHLIIATQRPSVNVITGTIKANFPTRIAFRVSSKIDSRTILDSSGAEQLIGRGDMLYSNGSDLVRLQCGFIDTPEVEKITDFIATQRGYTDAYLLPDVPMEQGSDKEEALPPGERDELFAEAARIVVLHQQGSTSLLQRKLKLGYNRAGRLMDQLEAAGIVGPFEGSKAREVKIHDLESLEQFLKNLK